MVVITCNNKKGDNEISTSKMFVLKRDGRKEPVMFDKITSRIQKLCYGLNMEYIDPTFITMKVISGLYSGVTTVELDELAAETAVMLSNKYPDYAVLAARIEISNLHKETKKSFSEVVEDLYNWSCKEGAKGPRMDQQFYEIVQRNADVLNSAIIYDRDFSYSYFSIKLLETDFLKTINGKVIERPQHMIMRVAVAIHGEDIESVMETYNMLSEKWFTVSSLALRNAGFSNGQLFDIYSSTMKSDSIEGIYDCLEDCGVIGRSGGSVGLNVHCIRSHGSYIAGTNGTSNGLTPMLRVFNSLVNFTHLGGEKTISPLTIYLEPWHADIFDFIMLKKPTGKEEQRAKNLQYALWIPDLFMKRTEEDGDWALMCPHDSQQLQKLWGKEFEEQYSNFENEGRYVKVIKARQLWAALIQSQIETGGPVMLYKDNINRKSNFKNSGTIFSSSHMGELMVYTSPEEFPACCSALICLHQFVKQDKTFDFDKLKECSKGLTRTLNKMIDVNKFPVDESKLAAIRQRPLAIGVQGFANTLVLMRYSYESDEAKLFNKHICETIYYGAMEGSCELAEKYGPYETYKGSPASQGIFQFDMWNVSPTTLHDWTKLKEKVASFGIRNSVLIGFTTSELNARLHNCNVGTEPFGCNMENMKITGEKSMRVVNHHLLKDLIEIGLWDDDMETRVLDNGGSIQNIDEIPDSIKQLYKSAWELSQKEIFQMAADRGPFVDQSQSINIRMSNPNYGKITSMHFFGWSKGLKNGLSNLESKVFTPVNTSNKNAAQDKKMVQSETQTDHEGKNDTKATTNEDSCHGLLVGQ